MNVFAPGTYVKGSSGEEHENRDREIVAARESARDWSNKLIVLTSSIVGFSVSLFSIDAIKKNIDATTLRLSWYWFLGTIVLSILALIFESRTVFASQWRKNALGFSAPSSVARASAAVYFNAVIIFVVALFYPTHLIFGKKGKDETHEEWQNSHVIVANWFSRAKNLTFLLETLSFIFFVIGLWYLINSVGN